MDRPAPLEPRRDCARPPQTPPALTRDLSPRGFTRQHGRGRPPAEAKEPVMIRTSGLGTRAADFVWAVGIENTFVPHTRSGHRRLDEYELMDHYRQWRQDLDLAADLGISAIRYGIPWYKVNPEPGRFDWSWTDAV